MSSLSSSYYNRSHPIMSSRYILLSEPCLVNPAQWTLILDVLYSKWLFWHFVYYCYELSWLYHDIVLLSLVRSTDYVRKAILSLRSYHQYDLYHCLLWERYVTGWKYTGRIGSVKDRYSRVKTWWTVTSQNKHIWKFIISL